MCIKLVNYWDARSAKRQKEKSQFNVRLLFYVLLTAHPGMILVNNQIDAQFFMYVYFYCLHVSDRHVPISRRIIVSMRQLVYVNLCRWPSGTHNRRSSTNTIILLMMGTWLPETCTVQNKTKRTWKIVRQVGYLQGLMLVFCSVFFIRHFYGLSWNITF